MCRKNPRSDRIVQTLAHRLKREREKKKERAKEASGRIGEQQRATRNAESCAVHDAMEELVSYVTSPLWGKISALFVSLVTARLEL